MQSSHKQGMLIVFEGMEGASKSTQSRLFVDWLKSHDIPHLHLREPNGKVREILLDPSSVLHDYTEVLLFAASRINTFKNVIEPALAEGQVVVCDRYLESSLAYQGHAGNVGMDKVQHIHDMFVSDGRTTLLFDIPIEVSRQRIGARGENLDRMEQKNFEYHTKVREGYLEIAKNNDFVKVIDATKSIEEIHFNVMNVLEPLLKERGIL